MAITYFIGVDMEVEINDECIPYSYDAVINHYAENYGEDADGNRGVEQTYIEEITEIVIYDESGNEIECPDEILSTAVVEHAEDRFYNN